MIIEIIKSEYWSKSDAFLLPLTGIKKSILTNVRSYLFWKNYSIENYNLIVVVEGSDKFERDEYARMELFPVFDKNGYLIESYDSEDKSIYVLDISEWAMDIEMFISGKYSKMSSEAKKMIVKFHTYNKSNIHVHIYGVLYPKEPLPILDNKSPLQYVIDNYGEGFEALEEIGEIGGIYVKESETLVISDNETIVDDNMTV